MDTESEPLNTDRQQMQKKLFSSVAHDLKTPLACIIGSLEIIEHMKEKLSNEQRETLISMALAEARRLDDLFIIMLEKIKP